MSSEPFITVVIRDVPVPKTYFINVSQITHVTYQRAASGIERLTSKGRKIDESTAASASGKQSELEIHWRAEHGFLTISGQQADDLKELFERLSTPLGDDYCL